jgi:hypothetical protein
VPLVWCPCPSPPCTFPHRPPLPTPRARTRRLPLPAGIAQSGVGGRHWEGVSPTWASPPPTPSTHSTLSAPSSNSSCTTSGQSVVQYTRESSALSVASAGSGGDMLPLAPTPHAMQLAGMGSRAIEDLSSQSWRSMAGLGESILGAHPQLIMGVMSLGLGGPQGGGGQGAASTPRDGGGGVGGGRDGVSAGGGRFAAGAAPRVRSAGDALVSPRCRRASDMLMAAPRLAQACWLLCDAAMQMLRCFADAPLLCEACCHAN